MPKNVFCFLLLCLSRFLLQAEGIPASAPSLGLDVPDNDVNDVMCHVRGCDYDLQLYCLSNGAIVLGSCSLKQTLCSNGRRNELRVASSWSVCWEATYTVDQRNPAHKIDHVKESQPSTDDSLSDETQFSDEVEEQPSTDDSLLDETQFSDDVKEQPSTDDSLSDETQFSDDVEEQLPIKKPLHSPFTAKV